MKKKPNLITQEHIDEKINYFSVKKILEYAGCMTLYLSVCGMINQYILLDKFGISLSDHADIDDFLVASINLLYTSERTVMIYFISFSSFMIGIPFIVHINYKLGLISKESIPKHIKWLIILFLTVIPAGFSSFQATDYFEKVINGTVRTINVVLQKPEKGFGMVIEGSYLVPLTGLNSTYFAVEVTPTTDKKEKKVKIVAVHAIQNINIAQIVYLPPKKK
jgi:hypothetical protein